MAKKTAKKPVKKIKPKSKTKATKPVKTEPKKRGAYKRAELENYALFTALPKKDRIEHFGFHTDQEFAREFDLHAGTLSDWKYSPELYEAREKYMIHFRKHTANIIGKFAERAEKRGDSFDVLTFMKVVENWSEKSSLDVTSKGKKVTGFNVIVHNAPDRKSTDSPG
jgi:hypothetical protein